MRWLHLTDIHIGGPNEAQRSALQSVVEAILTHSDGAVFDAVLLTGDLAYSGRDEQYTLFHQQLLEPLQQSAAFKASTVISVPGNHDINCDTALPLDWNTLDKARKTKWFGNDQAGQLVRKPRATGFQAYSDYIKRAGIRGIDPCKQCSCTHTLSIDGHNYAFLLLNTALFSDSAQSDKERTPAPLLALRSEVQAIHPDATKVVVGHHPISWFVHTTQEPFRTALMEANAIYVHGHLHEVRVSHSSKGLEAIGFGAAYAKPLDANADAYYKNSFAICELSDALHVAIYTWDDVHGKWLISNQLPTDFHTPSDTLTRGYRLQTPAPLRRGHISAPAHSIADRPATSPTAILVLEVPEREAWRRLLALIGEVDGDMDVIATDGPGELELLVDSAHGKRLVRCISGQGRILTQREVELENTRLDTDDHDALTIVSLGKAEDRARELATRLARKKPLKLMCNEDLAELLGRRLIGAVAKHVESLDTHSTKAAYLFHGGNIGVVVRDAIHGGWFYIVRPDGCIAEPSDPTVLRIREAHEDLAHATYATPGGAEQAAETRTTQSGFARAPYLESCHAEFNDVKYAPLAALGFKFPKAKLRDIYVPATAELDASEGLSEQLRDTIEDILDSLQLDEATRSQVRAQFTERYLKGSREGGSARGFYQQHRNVLVLGDPGSGKTCFVKHEVLNYCQPPSPGSYWYQLHTPIFVPLVEAAALIGSDTRLVDLCVSVAQNRGLSITSPQLESLVANGHVAFFFDGLDEVPSLAVRARLLRVIAEAMDTMTPLGNRVVVTSRPAALEGLDVPRGLVTLHLCHLTTAEIRQLATKILSMHLTEDGERIELKNEPQRDDGNIIGALLSDCERKPGIGRLARNPLLLSLLVMIYANSGAPAAKRHRIYAQAVQTLVSVRNRTPGLAVLSEADLRHRLGTLALAIMNKESSELPTRRDVVEIVARTMIDEGIGGDISGAADAFVQKVAESTGLITIHARGAQDATVTFMHHSFLEYYAAVGLALKQDTRFIANHAKERRWQEVISLTAGLIGDQAGGVAPLIDKLLESPTKEEGVTQSHLLFAFDCALECDVPPERTQRALVVAVEGAMTSGPGRVDPEFRSELAERLARLLEATGSRILIDHLRTKLTSRDTKILAAYVDLVGRIGAIVALPNELTGQINALWQQKDSQLRIALFSAIGRSRALISPEASNQIPVGLQESFPVKLAAVRAASEIPAVTAEIEKSLRLAVDDAQAPVAAAAARALLASGLPVLSGDRNTKLLAEKCLRRWEHLAEPKSASKLSITVDRDALDLLLSSPAEENRVLGIRLLPWLERREAYTHQRLFEVLEGSRTTIELLAALSSLRMSSGAMALCGSAEIDSLIQLCSSTHLTREVRVAASRALAALPPEERIISTILERCRATEQGAPTEHCEHLRAVATFAPGHEGVREYLREALQRHVSKAAGGHLGNAKKQATLRRLMRVTADAEVTMGHGTAGMLVAVADNFSAPKDLRTQSIRTYARVVPPSQTAVNVLVRWIAKRLPPYDSVVPGTIPRLLRRTRQRLDHVQAIFPALPKLEEALLEEWYRLVPGRTRLVNDPGARGVRAALRELHDLKAAFSEFDGRAKATSPPREEHVEADVDE